MIDFELALHNVSNMPKVDVYIICKKSNWCHYAERCDINECNGELGIIFTSAPLLRLDWLSETSKFLCKP